MARPDWSLWMSPARGDDVVQCLWMTCGAPAGAHSGPAAASTRRGTTCATLGTAATR